MFTGTRQTERERHCESRVNLPHAYQHVCIISLHFVSHFLLFQPEETHLISSSGGLFTPEQVAANIVTGIKVWKSCFLVLVFLFLFSKLSLDGLWVLPVPPQNPVKSSPSPRHLLKVWTYCRHTGGQKGRVFIFSIPLLFFNKCSILNYKFCLVNVGKPTASLSQTTNPWYGSWGFAWHEQTWCI